MIISYTWVLWTLRDPAWSELDLESWEFALVQPSGFSELVFGMLRGMSVYMVLGSTKAAAAYDRLGHVHKFCLHLPCARK